MFTWQVRQATPTVDSVVGAAPKIFNIKKQNTTVVAFPTCPHNTISVELSSLDKIKHTLT